MNTKPTIKNFIVVILPALLAVFIIFFLVMPKVKENRVINENNKTYTEEIKGKIAADSEPILTEKEAILIAGSTSECTMEGIPENTAAYNSFSKTWWVNLERMPELENDGCNPACVVREENKTAEVNWRCTGLIEPATSTDKTIQKLFIEKYPKYADTLYVNISQETEEHVRGNVIFETGAPGGYFLAAKINNVWQIVLDGNGQIPCSLSEYGFPAEMLSDCAE